MISGLQGAKHSAEANCLAFFFDLFRTLAGIHLSIFKKMCHTNVTKISEQAGRNSAVR